ncbi:MAG TPA: Maf family protein [Nitrospirota bacterium]|nr:Maf family protein [Nitrospirota bacterium]
MTFPEIILASASPRRSELLAQAGIKFVVDPAHVDESRLPGERPEDYAVRAALDKARATADRHGSGIVMGADTIVVVDGEILGKPGGRDEARQMLSRISGRTHTVMTGVALVDAATGRSATGFEATEVTIRRLAPEEIEEYVDSGEPMDKAGAYGIQGRFAVYVEGVRGCFFNVVGLPLSRAALMLKGF